MGCRRQRWKHWLRLSDIDYFEPPSVHAILGMPFLASVEPDDLLALGAMSLLADGGLLALFLTHPDFQAGITDRQTVLVIAGAYAEEVWQIKRLLGPTSVETAIMGTKHTPDLKVSVLRTKTRDNPWPQTATAVRDAAEFAGRGYEPAPAGPARDSCPGRRGGG